MILFTFDQTNSQTNDALLLFPFYAIGYLFIKAIRTAAHANRDFRKCRKH